LIGFSEVRDIKFPFLAQNLTIFGVADSWSNTGRN
jgi:hypothetical protein